MRFSNRVVIKSMSNYLAIATVTATLQRILQAAIQADIAGARVTTVRPDATGGGTPEVGVNVFLYQANPNPAWRNADLRNRRPKGELAKQAQAGLDLHYLLSFYGNEVELEPQRLLGSTVRTLVDQPILTPEMIEETLSYSTFSFLQGSTLAQQVERVTLVPANLSTDDLSKIWSVFFQSPYVLSFAYHGSTVLIEGEKPGRSSLPLRSRQFFVMPNQPLIKSIEIEGEPNQPAILSSVVKIKGQQLQRSTVQVRIGNAKAIPQRVVDTELTVDLSAQPPTVVELLRAGGQTLQVLQSSSTVENLGSNSVPFVLCPTILSIQAAPIADEGDELYSGTITVELDLLVNSEQRVFILLNQRSTHQAYVFNSEQRRSETRSLTFPIRDVQRGEYLVRVQIDGAESLLSVDTDPESPTAEQYIYPMIGIA